MQQSLKLQAAWTLSVRLLVYHLALLMKVPPASQPC